MATRRKMREAYKKRKPNAPEKLPENKFPEGVTIARLIPESHVEELVIKSGINENIENALKKVLPITCLPPWADSYGVLSMKVSIVVVLYFLQNQSTEPDVALHNAIHECIPDSCVPSGMRNVCELAHRVVMEVGKDQTVGKLKNSEMN